MTTIPAAASVDAAQLTARLIRPGGLWTQISAVAATGSTNADLAAAARAGAPGGAVLIADHQSAGRGRFSRVWQAPPRGSLAISVLLRPPPAVPVQRWLWLPLIAGLAVAGTVRSLTGLAAALKWPNDVLIGDGKLCGILAERITGADGSAAVIGMGINTTLSAEQLPVPTATSLRLAGADPAPGELVAELLTQFEGWYRRWLAGDDLRAEYTAVCTTIGRRVRVELSATEAAIGDADGVDADGRLLVQVDGVEQAFAAGDVLHLR